MRGVSVIDGVAEDWICNWRGNAGERLNKCIPNALPDFAAKEHTGGGASDGMWLAQLG